MKFFWVGAAYPEGINAVMEKLNEENLKNMSYDVLKEKIYDAGLDYVSKGWSSALELMGYEMEYVMYNAEILQHKWYIENVKKTVDEVTLEEILYLQIKKFKPQIIYVNDCLSESFINRLRNDISALRLVIAWSGSAVAKNTHLINMWRSVDFILCCAPESVRYLKAQGAKCFHMNHAFFYDDKFIYPATKCENAVTFIGSLIRNKDYHMFREKMLLELSRKMPVKIYSPSACCKLHSYIKALFKIGIYDLLQALPFVDTFLGNKFERLSELKNAGRPLLPVNSSLKTYLCRPVFGFEMLDVLHSSEVVLNIHADSSPQYASNMRLYEATGVNSCLLTDHKENIGELFKVNEEIVTYTCVEDCVEKASWLIKHPDVRKRIAIAGNRRCMKDHTYATRAKQLDGIIKNELSVVDLF